MTSTSEAALGRPDKATSGRAPVALVTGSSRGLGRGIALELARAGFSIAIHYSGNEAAARASLDLCEAIAAEAEAVVTGAQTIVAEAFPPVAKARPGRRFEIFQCDLSDAGQRRKLAEAVFESFGTLDALVNNAGMAPRVRADILEASETSFEELIRTNVQGPYFLTQDIARRWLAAPLAAPATAKGTASGATLGAASPEASSKASASPLRPPVDCPLAGGRKVVFVTSISAETASVNRGDYCVSKAALSMAAKLWATRLAPEGIQAYEVRPGIMFTDMTSGVKAKYDALIAQGIVPQGRWGESADVGRAVRALLEGAFAFSAGGVFDVDGGFHISRL